MASETVEVFANRRPLGLECLEERIAPAGVITAVVSGGNLTITGDAEANALVLDAAGLGANQLRITPTAGTTLDGDTLLDGITGGIKISLGDGADSVAIHGIAATRSIQIDGGAGVDAVLVDSSSEVGGSLMLSDVDLSQFVDVTVAGSVKIAYTTDGRYAVAMDRGQVGGSFSIANRGQDLFSSFAIGLSTIEGSLAVSNKTGAHGSGDASHLLIHDTFVGGVKVKAGTGDYTF